MPIHPFDGLTAAEDVRIRAGTLEEDVVFTGAVHLIQRSLLLGCIKTRTRRMVYLVVAWRTLSMYHRASDDTEPDATKTLSDSIKDKLKALGKDRYKFIVHVVIGESREQGIRSGTRCFWDASTDQTASATCVNDSLFICATAFAVYLY